ncbi:MAG: nucleotidyltransferase family protein [Halioglobus sp.]
MTPALTQPEPTDSAPGVLVLAAGRSNRFGSDKRQALLDDNVSVLDRLLTTLEVSGLAVCVCLAPGDNDLSVNLAARGVATVYCPRAHEGLGATLAHGITAVHTWPATLIALADMPWINASTLQALASHCSADTIVAPRFDGRQGHPVGFGRTFYPLLRALQGDTGGRAILRSNPASVQFVDVDDPAIHWDIDTPADLTRGDSAS